MLFKLAVGHLSKNVHQAIKTVTQDMGQVKGTDLREIYMTAEVMGEKTVNEKRLSIFKGITMLNVYI